MCGLVVNLAGIFAFRHAHAHGHSHGSSHSHGAGHHGHSHGSHSNHSDHGHHSGHGHGHGHSHKGHGHGACSDDPSHKTSANMQGIVKALYNKLNFNLVFFPNSRKEPFKSSKIPKCG